LSQHTKQLLKDGFIYALLFLLLMASLLIPLSLITFWLLPLPFFILHVKYGWKSTGFIGILIAYVLDKFVHPFTFFFVLYAFLIGSIMGRSYRQPTAAGTDVLLSGIVISCICSWGVLLLGEFLFNVSDELRQYLGQYTGKQLLDVETFLLFFLFILSVLPPFCTFFAGRYILHKQRYAKKYLPLFRNWRMPKLFFYFYVILMIFEFFTEESPAIAGIEFILSILFLVQGLSFITFLLHLYQKSQLWLIPISVSVFIPLVTVVVVIIGIIDMIYEIREWIRAKK